MHGRFWDELASHGSAVALIDGESGEQWTYRALADDVGAGARHLSSVRRKVVLLAADNDVGGILCYLSALKAGHAVFLCGNRSNDPLGGEILDRYFPDIVIWKSAAAEHLSRRDYRLADPLFGYNVAFSASQHGEIDDQLTLLLSTSGSTGSHKLVRLSASNLAAGAQQVATTLEIDPHECAITNLPISFVYGLTILHSHLAAGASIVVTQHSIVHHAFWKIFQTHGVTSLAGVPWTYLTLRQISFEKMECRNLRKLTHSGGRLDEPTRQWLIDVFPQRGTAVYFMYGQTEAGGRISVLPPSLAREKSTSVGNSVPNGLIECEPNGEVVYRGPNVMQGYATCRQDLQRGDDLNGVLHTGDLGFLDKEGQLTLVGRASRLCKLLGFRISLDEIELQFGMPGRIAALSDDIRLYIFAENDRLAEILPQITRVAERIRIPSYLIVVREIANIPRTSSGKIQYSALTEFIELPTNPVRPNAPSP